MGTGRLPLHHCHFHYNIFDWSSSATIQSGRDARLALSAKLYAATEAGLQLRFEKHADLEPFNQKVVDMLSDFDNLGNFISPLSGILVLVMESRLF